MKGLLFLVVLFAFCLTDCSKEGHTQSIVSNAQALRVFASLNATTNDLVGATQWLQASKTTNEPAAFWAAIANDPNYGVGHRRLAVVELFARHFKPDMTLREIGRMLNHPTWFEKGDCVPFGGGATPPGGNLNDDWFWIVVLNEHHRSTVIWFRDTNRERRQISDIYRCLKGELTNSPTCDIKISGIVLDTPTPDSHHQFHIINAATNFFATDNDVAPP